MVVMLTGKQADAGIIASGTVVVPIATPFRKLYVLRMSVVQLVLPAGSFEVFPRIWKTNPTTGVIDALLNQIQANASSLKADLQTAGVVGVLPFFSSVTDQDRLISQGSQLIVQVVANGTVTTQPVGMTFMIECAVLE